jgi:hypothetical protein
LLLAVNRELPGGRKGRAGKRDKADKGRETVKGTYCPPPGMVRVSGSFLWIGKGRKT